MVYPRMMKKKRVLGKCLGILAQMPMVVASTKEPKFVARASGVVASEIQTHPIGE